MSTLIVGALVFGLIAAAVVKIVRNHRSGGCGCGCEGCKKSSEHSKPASKER